MDRVVDRVDGVHEEELEPRGINARSNAVVASIPKPLGVRTAGIVRGDEAAIEGSIAIDGAVLSPSRRLRLIKDAPASLGATPEMRGYNEPEDWSA